MVTVQPSFDAALLKGWIELARRQGERGDGAIWQRLIELSAASPQGLARGLLDWQGVGSLSDEEWARVERLPQDADRALPYVPLRLDEQLLLLSDDPWAPSAIAALNAGRYPGAILALARPKQFSFCVQAPQQAVVEAKPSRHNPVGDASPVVDFVDAAVVRAYDEGASDIHFETDREGIAVKYRLDGVMAAGDRLLDTQRAEEVISRIKVMAQLDITERRKPQDGRIRWTHPGGRAIDLRVSIMPSIYGEDAVLRLLDKAQLRHGSPRISLDALGFEDSMCRAIRSLARRPHGMLLVTGPTGSGKTTTLYAALSEVNDGLEKIITIEDPVEYELPGVLQIPVNERKGLTFATGLRSILRHDPDKILVGEIRDAETAEIAVQSALTGHTVFTTVHANSVFDVLGRFQHFAIDPFALASALNGICVQRLLRRLCPHCAGRRALSEAEMSFLASVTSVVCEQIPTSVGCEHCRNSGYRGRIVIAETHEVTNRLRDLMVGRKSMTELEAVVYADREKRLMAVALRKVAQGVTTLEEVERVVGFT